MTFKSLEIALGGPKAPLNLIDPLFLTQMELLAVKLLKSKNGNDQDLPSFENVTKKEERCLIENANEVGTKRGIQSVKDKFQLPNSTEPETRFFNPFHESSPQRIQVYMFFSPNGIIQRNEQPLNTQKENQSRIDNRNSSLNPEYFSNISSQCKSTHSDSNKKSYNPNEAGLYYLKESNQNPQISTAFVDGERRLIVQIKRDPAKIQNDSNQLPREIKQNLSALDNRGNESNPTNEGWAVNIQNTNSLNYSQNIMNQGNVQQEHSNLGLQTQSPAVKNERVSTNQQFSLVGNNNASSQADQNFFSFGKNQKSIQKTYFSPTKIQEVNQEESSGNNEEQPERKSGILSFKRGNAGDPLPSHQQKVNWDKFVSKNIKQANEERDLIQRKKIEKRKKENRKLLLGDFDADDEEQTQKNTGNRGFRNQMHQDIQTLAFRQNQRNILKQSRDPNMYSPQSTSANQANLNQGVQNEQNTQNTQKTQASFLTQSLLMQNQQLDALIKKYNLESTPKKSKIEPTKPVQTFSQPLNVNAPTNQNIFNEIRSSEVAYQVFVSNQTEQKFDNADNPVNNLPQQNEKINFVENHQIIQFPVQTYQQNIFDQPDQSVHQFVQSQTTPFGETSSGHEFISQQQNSHVVTYGALFEFLYQKELERQNFQSSLQEKKQFQSKEQEFKEENCSKQNFMSLFEEFSQIISPSSVKNQSQSIDQKQQNQVPNSFDAFSQEIWCKIFNPSNSSSPLSSKQRILKLDSNLPFDIFIDLMTKYQRNIANEVIEEAQKLVGQRYLLSSNTEHCSLLNQIQQISNGSLKKSIDHLHQLLQVQLMELYYSIPKQQNGIKMNSQTGNIEYLLKSDLSQSELALYQYVENCMLNHNQIVNDPFYLVRRYDEVIENSLKQLIWIKQIDFTGRQDQNMPSFSQLLSNPNIPTFFDSPHEIDPAKMRQSVEKYLSELQKLSIKVEERIDLILYDLYEDEYKPSQIYYDLNSQSHVLNVYPQIDFSSNFPQSFLNQLGNDISFTQNVEKILISAQNNWNQNHSSIHEHNDAQIQTHFGELKNSTEMVQENQQNRISHFVQQVKNLLSKIQSDLQIMNLHISTQMNIG